MRPLATRTVGVMGDGRERHEAPARELGALLARLGVNLLTGGGGGVMESVSAAFVQARPETGICIGILPCAGLQERNRPKPGYPNPFVELSIVTHLPLSGAQGADDLSRNHINILSSDAVIALPGGAGTATEVALALRYGKPILVYTTNADLVAHFPAEVERTDRIDRVRQFLAERLPPAAG